MNDFSKIMVSAYACEPNRGSEAGVGWNWILQMSKFYELWVLTRSNNEKPINEWKVQHPASDFKRINFIYYDPPHQLTFWKKGNKGVHLFYFLWQIGANKVIKRVMMENSIKILHLLTLGNTLLPVSNYGIKQDFIWGPTGGLDFIEAEYSKYYSLKGRLLEAVRRVIIRSLRINIGFINRCKHAKLILCKTKQAYSFIPEKYKDKAVVFTDVAVDIVHTTDVPNFKNGSVINYITVGKLDGWRGFDILIEAFAAAYKNNNNLRLKIIGEGSERKNIERLIKKKNLINVISIVGQISYNLYHKEMIDCDVVINSCLKEGAVTNAFDCMSYGKPLICVDTGGYTNYFTNEFAIVLRREHRQQLIEKLKGAIELTTDYSIRETLSRRIIEAGKKVSWENKGQDIHKILHDRL